MDVFGITPNPKIGFCNLSFNLILFLTPNMYNETHPITKRTLPSMLLYIDKLVMKHQHEIAFMGCLVRHDITLQSNITLI